MSWGPSGRENLKLSIVIPCFNEVRTIERVIDSVEASPISPKEVILVDDGSTDGTGDLIRRRLAQRVDHIVSHSENRGKGAALRSGFAASTGDVVIIQDADVEYDPKDFPRLLRPIMENEAQVVYGSRFRTTSDRAVYYRNYVGNRVITLFSNLLTGLALSDVEVGYKLFRREILDQITIEEDGFGVEVELTAKVAKLGCSVSEVPLSYRGRTYEEGKKIRWRDGVWALWCLLKYSVLR